MKKSSIPVRLTGQHFTIDTDLIQKAIYLAVIKKDDLVLDIGAGRGFITVHLLKYTKNIIAVENDSQLVLELYSKFKNYISIDIVAIDYRRFSIPKRTFKVVSNIPFGITSYIFKSLMYNNFKYFLGGCLILQLEPAKKLVNSKYCNPYIVFYHTFFEFELIGEINPKSFIPPPKVKSALLKINRKKHVNRIEFEMKEKYIRFLFFMLKCPDLSLRTALKKIFRKKQIRIVEESYGLMLDYAVHTISPNHFWICFLTMLKVVPSRFHP